VKEADKKEGFKSKDRLAYKVRRRLVFYFIRDFDLILKLNNQNHSYKSKLKKQL